MHRSERSWRWVLKLWILPGAMVLQTSEPSCPSKKPQLSSQLRHMLQLDPDRSLECEAEKLWLIGRH